MRELYRQLNAEGWLDAWLDEEKLLPGQEWDIEIEKAVEAADVVLVCLSGRSVDKEGYVQKELRFVLNIADEKPESTIFVIPLKLEECSMPRRLRTWQWLEYFPQDRRAWAYQRLMESLMLRAARLGILAGKFADVKLHESPESVYNEEAECIPAEVRFQAEPLGMRFGGTLLVIGNDTFRIEFLRIPAGLFLMGSSDRDSLAYDAEKPQHTLELPNYWMARTPVTVEQFATFADANKAFKTTAEKDGSAWAYTGREWEYVKGAFWKAPRGPQSSVKKKPDHPVTQISWEDAMAYCQWLSDLCEGQLPANHILRLPTEAEWEKAARGAAGNVYPWGNDPPDDKRCNFAMNIKDTTPVGQYSLQGDSPYGCVDMAGNVWEWTHSLYKEYPYKQEDGREKENAGGRRVQRGGAFDDGTAWYVRCAYRNGQFFPHYGGGDDGFRLCVSPVSLQL